MEDVGEMDGSQPYAMGGVPEEPRHFDDADNIPGPTTLDGRLTATSRRGRVIRMPRHFNDFLPHDDVSLAHIPDADPVAGQSPEPSPSPPPPPVLQAFETRPNELGLFRRYAEYPTLHPDPGVSLDSVCNSSSFAPRRQDPATGPVVAHDGPSPTVLPFPHSPFRNRSSAIVMAWANSGVQNITAPTVNKLAHNIFDLGFKPEEMEGFDYGQEKARLDKFLQDANNPFLPDDGWHTASVKIRLPCEKKHWKSEQRAPQMEVPGLVYRRLFDIIKSVYQDKVTKTFHMMPFEQLWIPNKDRPEEIETILSETYSSPAMLEAHAEIAALPRAPNDILERLIMPLHMYSDSTHLASFGTASAWPIYLFFGSQSKYERCRPTAHACHHVAYIPTLPGDFNDIYMEHFGRSASQPVLSHCKRELMHGVWDILLDDEFMEAYYHGIVLLCIDGVYRRFFPRLFTYSADYPEKVLLACIKNLGRCPCTRCYVTKEEIPALGSIADMARRAAIRVDDDRRKAKVEAARDAIFKKGRKITGKPVERILHSDSLVPTRNAFSKLSTPEIKFDFHDMLTPDVLHEMELGVVKSTFAHSIRILQAHGADVIAELNSRYRSMPTFGRATIRRFHGNMSEMKKLAGRDYEDALQCAFAAFDGLLPDPYNDILLDLYFVLSSSHGYSKMQLHSTSSLSFFDDETVFLGRELRRFKSDLCPNFATRELPRETAARGRRNAAKAAKALLNNLDAQPAQLGDPEQSLDPQLKEFNMNTFKMHAIGYYPSVIRHKGTTDNWNTQMGELQHKQIKRRFARTNKDNFVPQLADQESRERFNIGLQERLLASRPEPRKKTPELPSNSMASRKAKAAAKKAAKKAAKAERLAKARSSDANGQGVLFSDPSARYHIAESTRKGIELTEWMVNHKADPAFANFHSDLYDHILERVRNVPFDAVPEFTDADRCEIQIVDNKIYAHATVRINYTTYDLRRAQDTINPRTHPDIILLSPQSLSDPSFHPFLYARVIGVYHAMVRDVGSQSLSAEPQRIDFVWVRWLNLDTSVPGGWAARRLYRVGFPEITTRDAFSFVDPKDIIRGVHLPPVFKLGLAPVLKVPSLASSFTKRRGEWYEWEYHRYYVNMFVDRDMIMRFRGGGVGHAATRYLDEWLKADRHVLEDDDPTLSVSNTDSDTPSDMSSPASTPPIVLDMPPTPLRDVTTRPRDQLLMI
ncbi:hypothetical protein BV25DRAFT_1913814 [Artomyces pyxidatus]|uniref:Uncharacterized protein n=1 Tax=Artomyces pyxidatus TaxID=48021 RepID=A0ACB8T9I8_9AGAM|nr:hypothetical protein BV25DRAFT_1913814 [Artomyces pyxidatus]